jgi:hypothetical protein
MHWQLGGERKMEKSCIASLEPIVRVKGELVHFFCIFAFWGCGLLLESSLTGFGNRPDRFVPRVGTCSWGSLHMCRGSSCLLCWFVLFA